MSRGPGGGGDGERSDESRTDPCEVGHPPADQVPTPGQHGQNTGRIHRVSRRQAVEIFFFYLK